MVPTRALREHPRMTSTARGRRVALVVVGPDGDVIGQMDPFVVDTPWWQDLAPVAALHPDLVILRLLHVDADPTGPMGGEVTYLAQAVRRPRGLRPFIGSNSWLADDPLRMPWARPGGPQSDLEWVASHVEFAGAPVQDRSWNLSAIWRVPVADGDVWLKCVPSFLAHEANVIARLGPSPSLPHVLAADGHRILLAPLPGVDGYGATVADEESIIATLVDLQCSLDRRAADRTALQNAVPSWHRDTLRATTVDLLDRDAHEFGRRRFPHIDQAVVRWDRTFAAIEACGIEDTLLHGDPHPGNARIGHGPPVIFDWGDSGWGNPLLDLAVVDRAPTDRREHLEGFWLDRWRAARPGTDPHQAFGLLRPFAGLRAAAVYQRFLDHIEASERVYHRDDVEQCLQRAEILFSPGA